MARASTYTMLPLDRYAKIMGIHPLHFNQVQLAPGDGIGCENPLAQYSWQQSDGIGREEIALAISDAERLISDALGFKPLPSFEVDERHVAPRFGNPVKANWGYANSAGIERKTALSLAETVTYSDSDSDGYSETATVTVEADGASADEIAVYYPGKAGADEWEIRPIKVTFSGTQAAITFRREQTVLEELTEAFNPRAADATDNAQFLTTVDVMRHWLDPSQQAQLLWSGPQYPAWNNAFCNCSDTNICSVCLETGQYGCATIRDWRSSILAVEPATWDANTESYTRALSAGRRPPERIRLWYRAGWRRMSLSRPSAEMDPAWERAIAYLASASLDRPLCSCKNTENIIHYWSEDMAKVVSDAGSSQSFRTSKDTLGNPFGTTRGAIFAWRAVQRESIGQAACVM